MSFLNPKLCLMTEWRKKLNDLRTSRHREICRRAGGCALAHQESITESDWNRPVNCGHMQGLGSQSEPCFVTSFGVHREVLRDAYHKTAASPLPPPPTYAPDLTTSQDNNSRILSTFRFCSTYLVPKHSVRDSCFATRILCFEHFLPNLFKAYCIPAIYMWKFTHTYCLFVQD